jgi:hypothetical protein
MTKQIRNPDEEEIGCKPPSPFNHSCFVIPSTFVIQALIFLGYSPAFNCTRR